MSAPLDIDQLQTFIAIVDTGSFTKAAGRVFKTQSAVSMQMRRLEERVGKQLFIKDGRGNRLTADIEEAEWQEAREDRMRAALVQLNPRERDILARRWLADEGEKAGLQELGDEDGVSAERIRQIESAAMKKLRKAIEA